MSEQYDIVIVGGGTVGATLATVLSRYQYRIALVEACAYDDANQARFGDRAIALSWGSSRILKQIGLWSEIELIAEPIKKIHVSDQGHFGLTRILAEEEQVPALGFAVTANELGKVLTSALPTQKTNQFCVFCPARVTAVKNSSNEVSLEIQQPERTDRIKAKLLIAADGAQSTVRDLLAIGSTHRDYQQDAIIANITPELNHNNIAFERFTGGGPIALLPMRAHGGSQRCALIWTVPRSNCKRLMQADDGLFLSQLQKEFGYRLGYLRSVGQRSSQALHLVKADSRVAHRVVFIGNAAQTIHPVAGQGFNLALRDMSILLDCLLYPQAASDPGNPDLLQRYMQMRKADQRRVILFTDTLIKVFGINVPGFSQIRAASLSLLDSLPPLRCRLTRTSMGLNTALPHI